MIKKHNVGYFCSKELTWADQIEICLNDSENRRIISRNAKNLYKKKFTSNLVYGKFVKFIEQNYNKKRSGGKSF